MPFPFFLFSFCFWQIAVSFLLPSFSFLEVFIPFLPPTSAWFFHIGFFLFLYFSPCFPLYFSELLFFSILFLLPQFAFFNFSPFFYSFQGHNGRRRRWLWWIEQPAGCIGAHTQAGQTSTSGLLKLVSRELFTLKFSKSSHPSIHRNGTNDHLKILNCIRVFVVGSFI